MKIQRIIFKLALTALTLFLFASQGWTYQEIEVQNGGTIQGQATLTGVMPPPRVYHLVLFPNIDMCAEVDADEEKENRLLDDFKVSPDGGMKDVLISLEHVEAGKPFVKDPIMIESENCKFTPDLNAVRQDETFKVDNLDAVMHNSQVYQKEQGKILINIPIPAEEVSEGKIHFKKKFKIYQMICGMHEFMQTWGYRVQNPYFSKTKIDGNFKIDNIPPGDYVVTAWHYLMKPQSKKVTISENAVIDLNFAFDGGQVERPIYETIKSGRIKHDAKIYKEKVFSK